MTLPGAAGRHLLASRVLSGGLTLALVLVLCGAASPDRTLRDRFVPLHAQTVGVGAGGRLVAVTDPDDLVPGSRVLVSSPDREAQLGEERAWLASGIQPVVPELGDSTLATAALLDLRTLSLPTGVPTAGWSPAWRYVWPRDGALAAAALARTGHPTEAESLLDFLQRVQPESGVFAARYLPDASGVPDERGPQLDGVGWALWALAAVTAAQPEDARPAFVRRHQQLLDRSTGAALTAVDTPDGLPPVSADYWERPESRLTLATAALVLAGLRAAGPLYRTVGSPAGRAQEEHTRAAADRLQRAVEARFGPDGYPRHLGGPRASVDLGVAFLLPPFSDRASAASVAGWRAAPRHLLRPAGGLAPGGSWPDDGISWTTATSSYALTAAALGDRATAVHWLRWLDAHRTAAGSLPEKVLADGSPASAAPLSWTAAAVLLTAVALTEGG